MSSINEQKPASISPIRQEYKRLQEVESELAVIWQCEVQAYENNNGIAAATSDDVALDTSAASSYGCYRNHPNSDGKITDPILFPYHDSLYPLLDCYDSIKHEEKTSNLKDDSIPPSKAPNPFATNGYRRSKFSPRLDPRGFHIEEVEFLEGHLPNSACAIRETILPLQRKIEYTEFIRDRSATGIGMGDIIEAEAANLDEPRPRFWKLLMNDKPKPNWSWSTVSLGPDADEYNQDNDREDISNATNARDFSFLTWWELEIVSNKSSSSSHFQSLVEAAARTTATPLESTGVHYLFANSSDPNMVLMRVLKHAMSDLQRDFRLARSVLLLITDLRLIDDECSTQQRKTRNGLETLRRLLTITSSEYIHCHGSCHEEYLANGGINHGALGENDNHHNDDHESIDLEETSNEENDWEGYHNNARLNDSRELECPNHYCSDWWQFLGSLSTCIAHGIEFMSQQHASVLCAFVLREIDVLVGIFNDAAGKSAEITATSEVGEATANTYKGLLKQNLFMLNSEAEEEKNPCRQLRVNLLVALVNGLKRHAIIHRKQLEKQSRCSDQSLASFNMCVEAIVDIGERILLKLPTNKTTCLLSGTVARALLEVHLESEVLDVIDSDKLYVAHANSRLRSMIDPLRYADAISNASNKPHQRKDDATILEQIGKPSQDVHDVIKGLFIRNLVDLCISGFGYGDFLMWFQLPISPKDIDLFLHYRNFPDLNDSQSEFWAQTEEGDVLDYTGLASRYDFSLMLLVREWDKPWNPSSHLSFGIPFRRAIKELAICAHRFGVPSDIVVAVNSFLPRSWWPDERDSCWCRDCQMVCLKDRFKEKILARQSNWSEYDIDASAKSQPPKIPKIPLSLITCKCNIAQACSKDHMVYVNQDGHKRCCGLPPLRELTEEDKAFMKDVMGEDSLEIIADECEEIEEGEDVEEDGDWESVDSNEHYTDSRTRSEKITKYFQDNSYRHMRREALPFQDFF